MGLFMFVIISTIVYKYFNYFSFVLINLMHI